MKLYKPEIKIKFKPFDISPFHFLSVLKDKINLTIDEINLRNKFKRQAWDYEYVFSHTTCCNSLNEAIQKLTWELTDYSSDTRLYPMAYKLIEAGFNKGWK